MTEYIFGSGVKCRSSCLSNELIIFINNVIGKGKTPGRHDDDVENFDKALLGNNKLYSYSSVKNANQTA